MKTPDGSSSSTDASPLMNSRRLTIDMASLHGTRRLLSLRFIVALDSDHDASMLSQCSKESEVNVIPVTLVSADVCEEKFFTEFKELPLEVLLGERFVLLKVVRK